MRTCWQNILASIPNFRDRYVHFPVDTQQKKLWALWRYFYERHVKKTCWEICPSRISDPFFLLIFLFTLGYGIGMKMGSNAWSAGGFVGVIVSVIPVCNMCYRRGYTDGQSDAKAQSSS
jgi:hypothetical protein